MDLKSTLNLPDADFTIPMKADLPQREPEIQARWDEIGIYHAVLKAREDAPTYVLHDGPPYTNSAIHIGTAMNKVLKDFVVKSRTMMGFRCPYVPGFDNHGLPIEQAVQRGFQERKERPDIPTFRQACRAHAEKYVGVQTEQFKRLGVFGLWEKPYVTMGFRYEAEIVRTFKRLVERGQVYRGLRPVLWSPTCRTALADSEIVYQDHTSTAIYVRFPLREDPHGMFRQFQDSVYTIIWTTTPWTIPANLAVAFHPDLNYALVRHEGNLYVLLDDLVQRTMEACALEGWQHVGLIAGKSLEGCKFKHPVFDRDSLAVTADYVTTEDGTGVVHTAPGHGREDFYTGLKNNLPILCPVDEGGIMTEEAGEFAGLTLAACNEAVVERLDELGNLLSREDYVHSYPHAERDGKPVIFRATDQWFVSIDENDLRQYMLREVDKVSWIPPSGETRIRAMIANRPDWCISRQRPWGVGIPVFYGKPSGAPVLDPAAIECVAHLIEREGSDAWFVKDPAEILPRGYRHPETGETEFAKEVDVFDVWFDSGATSLCVLEGNVEPEWKEPWPADLYLEGSDQHRGWFNQSMVLGVATRGEAPYKTVVTHGFVVDEKGLKMSKRYGNVIDPVEACNRYGADVLRYWTASVDYVNDVPCSENLLKQCGECYRRIRNTLRFLLSNLYDYDYPWDYVGKQLEAPGMFGYRYAVIESDHRTEHRFRDEPMLELDRWIMEQTDLLVADAVGAYERFDFNAVVSSVHNFCVQQLSAFYLDAIKDRMYCDGPDWPSRRSAQTACRYVLIQLVRLLAPVLPHTAEEVYGRIPGLNHLVSVHAETFALPSAERLESIEGNDLQTRFAALIELRAGLFAQFEQWKSESEVKDSQDVVASIVAPAETIAILRSFGDELPNLFKMSAVELCEGEQSFAFRPSPYPKCERSRLRRPDVEVVDGVPLTARDRRALGL